MTITVQRVDADGSERTPMTFTDQGMLLGWITLAMNATEEPFALRFSPVVPTVHEVTFAAQPGPGCWAHIAVCACGWRDVRGSREDAERSADEHADAFSRKQQRPDA